MSFLEIASQFHFLRPLWLLALISVPIVLWLSTRSQTYSDSDWNKAIPPELLQHLLVGQSSSSNTTQHWKWIAIVIAIMTLGLAGPSWQQKPQPLQQQSDNLAIVLDLSLSMLASDQKPDRLTRAKHKLIDLLEQRKEGNTALIVYSGDSYVVTPLTDDINTLKSMLPPLDPFIMPAMGSRPELAIEQAIDVLKNGGGTEGKILLITDGIEANNLSQIDQLLKDTPFPLSVLAVGTEQGGPINIPERGYLKDNGSVIIPKTDFDLLDQLAANHSGVMEPISFNDSDIEALNAITSVKTDLPHGSHNHESSDSENSLYDQWHDEGYWFAFLLIPLVLLGHRRGAFSLVLILSFSLQPNEAMAFEWKDLWKTPDQQAMEIVNKDPAKAAELFQDPQWKGTAQYKAKKFEEAQQSFAAVPSTTSLYNQATALAQQQKFEEAINSYNDVLQQDPHHADAATNKALIEKFLEQQSQDQQSSDQSEQGDSESKDQQDQQQNQDQQGQNGDQKDSQDQGSQSEQNNQQQDQSDKSNRDQSEQSESSQDSSEQSSQDQSQEPSQGQPEQKSADQEASQQANASEQSEQSEQDAQSGEQQHAQAREQDELTDEETQAFEQWMRRVPDDPGGLLRRKFAQQYQQKRGQQSQKEGQPIW